MAGHKVTIDSDSTDRSVWFFWRCACGKRSRRTFAQASWASRDAKNKGHR